MLVWGMGGGGTSGAIIPSGGDINAVLIEIEGGALGLRREDGIDTLRGTGAVLGTTVALAGKYDDVELATEGRLLGCDTARFLPTLDNALVGKAIWPILGTDAAEVVESVGDDEDVDEGGAEVLTRRCEMVPITGEVLIRGGIFVGVASDRVEKVDPPLGRGVVKCEPA